MKFIHFSDLHLSRIPDADQAWGEMRAGELWDAFSQIIDDCNRERADLLLISGNLFDRQPSKKEADELNRIFGRLRRTQVVAIAGPEDYMRPGSFYEGSWGNQVHFVTGEGLQCMNLRFLGVKVYGVSYHSPEITARLFDELPLMTGEDINILLINSTDETHCPADVQKLATAGFDYVALGGGTPKLWEREKMARSGSPEPLSSDDTGRHGYILGEVLNGHTTMKLIPIARREYKHVALSVSEGETVQSLDGRLRDIIAEKGSANIYTVTLKGAAVDMEEASDTLKRCGNVCEIIDETGKNLDPQKVAAAHSGDLIGKYIEMFKEEKDAESACSAGLIALLKSRG